MERKSICVNYFAGPGAGKSTFCANVFAELKWKNIECEMALEWIKEAVWEERFEVLKNQFYVFGNQLHRITRLNGKVDVILTDSPLLNSIIYDAQNDEDFKRLILKTHSKFNNINFFIERVKEYNPNGRVHSYEEAIELDNKIKNVLKENNIEFETIPGHPENSHIIVNKIIEKMNLLS